MDVMAELKPIGALFSVGEFAEGLKYLRDLWAKIPTPKSDTLNSYFIIEYGVAFALKLGDLGEAQRWADMAPEFAKVRQDMGEVEFLVGKVAFERGDFATAKKNFVVANVKSEGRSFQDEDPKYRELLL